VTAAALQGRERGRQDCHTAVERSGGVADNCWFEAEVADMDSLPGSRVGLDILALGRSPVEEDQC
jgi:hypothetical protein